MRTVKNIFYGSEELKEKTLDLYIPDGQCRAVFLYMHGGGLEAGSKDAHLREGEFLAAHGYGFVSVEYRMFPKAVFPDFVNDAAQAVAWTLKNAERYFGCKRLYVGGSSAGGYLSMMLCFDRRYYESVGITNADIAGYFHDAGQPSAHYNVLKYSGTDFRRVIVDERAPIYFVGLEKSYPRMRFVVSDKDMVGRYEQTQLMIKTLEHFGHKNFDLKVMHGKHCQYINTTMADGTTELSHMIYEFLIDNEDERG